MADCPPYLPKSGESLVPPAGFAENKCNSCAKNSQIPIVFRKDLRATVADEASRDPPMTKPVWKQACVETSLRGNRSGPLVDPQDPSSSGRQVLRNWRGLI
jgi:hypothetical protein